MKYHAIPADALTQAQIATWRAIQSSEASLQRPHLSPEFPLLVARHRPQAMVVLAEEAGTIVGFLPFALGKNGVARPVAGSFTDFQGLVAHPDVTFDAGDLLRETGLTAIHFDHWLASQRPMQPYFWRRSPSPYIDLTGGFDAYCAERRSAGSREVQEAMRKTRKIQREVAPLRLEPYCTNPEVLGMLIDWKVQQLRHRGLSNVFAIPWVRPMLNEVVATKELGFAGMLTALFVGDELAAATLGIRHHDVLHGWVTAYNPKYARYSPGRILIVALADAANSLGIRRIDMGRGDDPFKRSLATASTMLAEGAVDARFVARTLRRGWIQTKNWLDASPLGPPARELVNRVRRVSLPWNQAIS